MMRSRKESDGDNNDAFPRRVTRERITIIAVPVLSYHEERSFIVRSDDVTERAMRRSREESDGDRNDAFPRREDKPRVTETKEF